MKLRVRLEHRYSGDKNLKYRVINFKARFTVVQFKRETKLSAIRNSVNNLACIVLPNNQDVSEWHSVLIAQIDK